MISIKSHSFRWLCFVVGLVAPHLSMGQDAVIPLHEDSVVRFATKAEGITAVTTKDAFIEALSNFDKQSRLMTGKPVTTEEYLKFVSNEVKAFDPAA